MYNLERIPSIALGMDGFTKYCAITVALKIADDSCKMNNYEKEVFMMLYDAVKDLENELFNNIFNTIKLAQENPTAKIYAKIKRLREDAMDVITQPKMKAFKAEFRKKILD